MSNLFYSFVIAVCICISGGSAFVAPSSRGLLQLSPTHIILSQQNIVLSSSNYDNDNFDDCVGAPESASGRRRFLESSTKAAVAIVGVNKVIGSESANAATKIYEPSPDLFQARYISLLVHQRGLVSSLPRGWQLQMQP